MESHYSEISERHLDLALEELLRGSVPFCDRLLSELGMDAFASTMGGTLDTVAVSVESDSGETDVLAEWARPDGRRLLVFIEDKLTAAFQPTQGRRYASRVTAANGIGVEARSVLVAPRSYLRVANPEVRFFDAQLAIEDMSEWGAAAPADNRIAACLSFLREAVRRVNEQQALGAKGLYPDLHAAIQAECDRRQNGLTVSGKATDWVFLEHPARESGITIRYRIKDAVSELALKPPFRGDRDLALGACRSPFSTASSGTFKFVRAPVGALSANARCGKCSADEVCRIVESLEALMDWWQAHGRPAAYRT